MKSILGLTYELYHTLQRKDQDKVCSTFKVGFKSYEKDVGWNYLF
jgi:hypothetical protein